MALKNGLILHPFNIILLFIINTSLINLKAGLPIIFKDAAVAFLIVLSLAIIIFFLFNFFIKNPVKTSIILSTILFITLFFRDINEIFIFFEITDALNFFPDIFGNLFFILILMLMLLVILVIYLIRTKRNLGKLNSYLNLLTIIFIVYELIGLAGFEESKVDLKEKVVLNSNKNAIEKPDIYFIILDEYTGFTGLKKFWGYDNSDLKNFLIKNGFFVAEKGRAVYTNTNYSLASSLNMTELNYIKENVYEISNYISLANHIKNSTVVDYLKKQGYVFVNMSFFDINSSEKYYQDIYYLKKGNIYQARTIYGHFYEIINEKFADMAKINLGIFKKLENINSVESGNPKFVYAHVMMPHPPFYFNAEGEKISFSAANDRNSLPNYLEYLKYTNKVLMKTIENILSSSERKPVIIVQGDHGFRSYEGKDKWQMQYSILNSIYFPDKDYSLLNDSLKSVNTFRIIFNKYFNQKLKLMQ